MGFRADWCGHRGFWLASDGVQAAVSRHSGPYPIAELMADSSAAAVAMLIVVNATACAALRAVGVPGDECRRPPSRPIGRVQLRARGVLEQTKISHPPRAAERPRTGKTTSWRSSGLAAATRSRTARRSNLRHVVRRRHRATQRVRNAASWARRRSPTILIRCIGAALVAATAVSFSSVASMLRWTNITSRQGKAPWPDA